MIRPFIKMHGLGNDYILLDCFESEPQDPAALAIRLSERHFSIGGDGLILVLPSNVADCRMRMFNADGSEGKMCGNGIRCIGKYLYEQRGVRKEKLTVETPAGIRTLRLFTEGETVVAVTADMGKPVFEPALIPTLFSDEKAVVGAPINAGENSYIVTCLSLGNPHCVVFGGDPDGLDLPKIGPCFETHPVFPEGVNTEFVQVLRPNVLKMRVWERGSGETLACGTGACAAAVAAVLSGYAEEEQPITVHLRGGELTVLYADGAVFLTGPAETSFFGEVEIP